MVLEKKTGEDQTRLSINTPSVYPVWNYLVVTYLFLNKENTRQLCPMPHPFFFPTEKSCSNLLSLVPSIKQGMTVAVRHVRPIPGHRDSTKTQQQSPMGVCMSFPPAGVSKPAEFFLISVKAGYLKRKCLSRDFNFFFLK